jgi:hypothetical protein
MSSLPMRIRNSSMITALGALLIGACSTSSSSNSDSGVGGATGGGGSAGVTGGGGAGSLGGASGATGGSAGGATGTGGAPSTAAGGATGTGGSPGTGGATGAGGRVDGGAPDVGGGNPGDGGAATTMNFFVTSDTSTTANLGGLAGADQRCQRLATAVGAGSKTWRAYLSAANPATNAMDRIGPGPYFNSQGAMVAATKAALHARTGDVTLFITELGGRVNGQWAGSPTPNQHDVLTGTNRDGTLATGLTCGDWVATTGNSQVGHTDGLGPNMATTGSLSFWNSAHTGMCGDTAPGGGAGRLYCFVGP